MGCTPALLMWLTGGAPGAVGGGAGALCSALPGALLGRSSVSGSATPGPATGSEACSGGSALLKPLLAGSRVLGSTVLTPTLGVGKPCVLRPPLEAGNGWLAVAGLAPARLLSGPQPLVSRVPPDMNVSTSHLRSASGPILWLLPSSIVGTAAGLRRSQPFRGLRAKYASTAATAAAAGNRRMGTLC